MTAAPALSNPRMSTWPGGFGVGAGEADPRRCSEGGPPVDLASGDADPAHAAANNAREAANPIKLSGSPP